MQWYVEAKRLGGLEIDHQLERGRLHDRQIGRLGAFEDLAGVKADLTKRGQKAGSVADQAAGQGVFPPCKRNMLAAFAANAELGPPIAAMTVT
jgi:hypothetical protein